MTSTVPLLVGDKNGITLWNIMAHSTDKLEQEYFARISAAATKFGVVWYSDCVTQREQRNNQMVFQLTWDAAKLQWKVTKFHLPEGAKEVTDRMETPDEVTELDILDLA